MVVLAIVGVVLVVAGSVFVALWRRSGAHEVSTGAARRRYEQSVSSSSTQPAPAAVLRPAAGVYTYRGSGTEHLSLPPKSQSQGPQMPGTVTLSSGGCWNFRIDYSNQHWQIWIYCPRNGGLVELGGQTFERWNFVFTTYDSTTTSTCNPASVAIRSYMQPGEEWKQQCRNMSSGTKGESLSSGPYTFVGDDVIEVGGVRVPAYHFRQERTLTGSQTGSQITDQWFAQKNGLPLRNVRTDTVHTKTIVGSSTYTEDGTFQLTALRPQV